MARKPKEETVDGCEVVFREFAAHSSQVRRRKSVAVSLIWWNRVRFVFQRKAPVVKSLWAKTISIQGPDETDLVAKWRTEPRRRSNDDAE